MTDYEQTNSVVANQLKIGDIIAHPSTDVLMWEPELYRVTKIVVNVPAETTTIDVAPERVIRHPKNPLVQTTVHIYRDIKVFVKK